MAISKMSRDPKEEVEALDSEEVEALDSEAFDFGEPEIIPVEIAPGKILCLREPSADDLIEISKISENDKISEVEATLQIICILHAPMNGQRRLSLKDAKKLRAKQLKLLGGTINELLGLGSGGDA